MVIYLNVWIFELANHVDLPKLRLGDRLKLFPKSIFELEFFRLRFRLHFEQTTGGETRLIRIQ